MGLWQVYITFWNYPKEMKIEKSSRDSHDIPCLLSVTLSDYVKLRKIEKVNLFNMTQISKRFQLRPIGRGNLK